MTAAVYFLAVVMATLGATRAEEAIGFWASAVLAAAAIVEFVTHLHGS